MLHHDVGESIGGAASVEDRRDIRMVQIGENLSLMKKSADHVHGVQSGPQEFDRDGLKVVLVIPDREINHAHPAVADLTNELIRTDPHPAELPGGRRQLPYSVGHHRLPNASKVRFVTQHRLDLATQLGIAAAGFLEIIKTTFGIPLHRRVEHGFDQPPAPGSHSGELPPICRWSHAWARRRSRPTVETDTPVTSEISSVVSPPKYFSSTMRDFLSSIRAND